MKKMMGKKVVNKAKAGNKSYTMANRTMDTGKPVARRKCPKKGCGGVMKNGHCSQCGYDEKK